MDFQDRIINNIDCAELEDTSRSMISNLDTLYEIIYRQSQNEKVLMCLVGKPTAPVFEPAVVAAKDYWSNIGDSPVQYGDFMGEMNYREKMAKALINQYNITFSHENILFMVSGVFCIKAFHALIEEKMDLGKKLVISSIHYPKHMNKKVGMIFVPSSDTFGPLSAKNLDDALKDRNDIGAFIFCDPSNPTGRTVGKEEWEKIIPILERYPDAPIALDEAYAEMVFGKKHESLISYATPDLLKRIVLMRSATKGMSLSGERMAVLVSHNNEYMKFFIEYNVSHMLHAPKSMQYIYAVAMEKFGHEAQQQLANFYCQSVRKVEKILEDNAFSLKRVVNATFYVIADFSRFKGHEIHKDALIYFSSPDKKYIESDVDLALHFLYQYKLGLAPMSFFGANTKDCYMRITAAFDNEKELSKFEETIAQMNIEITKNTICLKDVVFNSKVHSIT